MKHLGHIMAFCGIVLLALPSCRAISSLLNDEETVAEVGGSKLYRSDLDKVIPSGLNAEDSTRLARQYIESWASDLVFLDIAQQQLSKSERDVSKELEEYRKSLLKYRYEQLYVNERLDTAVSDERIDEYYEKHGDKFILERPILKARFLSISEDSPSLEPIRKKMSSSDAGDLLDADSLAYSSALKFTTWNDEWIDAVVLAREFGTDYASMLASMKGGWIEQTDSTGVKSLAYVAEMMNKGQRAPVEYCVPSIRDIIISARKQALISGLERDLLNDARSNGKYIIH